MTHENAASFAPPSSGTCFSSFLLPLLGPCCHLYLRFPIDLCARAPPPVINRDYGLVSRKLVSSMLTYRRFDNRAFWSHTAARIAFDRFPPSPTLPPDYPFFVGSSVYKSGDHQFPHDRLRAKGKRNRSGREARMLTPYLPAIAE